MSISWAEAMFLLFKRPRVMSEELEGFPWLRYFAIGFDDVDQNDTILMTHFYEWTLILHILYIFMVTVLLLNLIIAMMGQTFDREAQDMHKLWVFPYANIVRNSEYLLGDSDRRKIKNRFLRTPPPPRSKTGPTEPPKSY
ncbi:hypothetical protein T484DRAFT_2082950 [Baffinella frigidus]|nr:hypothetical protein T484DRAFT_2082950 [Cryptophyta sp. CCMP2293]